MEMSVAFTGACANEIIPSINRSFVYKAKEGCHIIIYFDSKDKREQTYKYNILFVKEVILP